MLEVARPRLRALVEDLLRRAPVLGKTQALAQAGKLWRAWADLAEVCVDLA